MVDDNLKDIIHATNTGWPHEKELHEKLKIAIEALEFYASKDNWKPFEDKCEAEIYYDRGDKSRNALLKLKGDGKNGVDENEKFKKLVAEKMEKEGPYFEFDYQNCDGPCAGWDGEDRRCQCGNRRVTWVLSDCGEYVYAEAY